MHYSLVLATFIVLVWGEEEISDCLKKCITPLAKQQRSFTHIFNNFEEICDILEAGAHCSKKCSQDDQAKFHSYSTFYRIYCIDYEEDLEPHLPCLRKITEESDQVCRERCTRLTKSLQDETEKSQQCFSLECMTLCYFHEFTEECPESKDVMIKLNIGQVHSIAQSIHPNTYAAMEPRCQDIHSTDYMKKMMLQPYEY